MFNLNPIDVLKQREIKTLPPHFVKTKVDDADFFGGGIAAWIQTKLKGRFCILRAPGIDSSGNLKSSTYIGFEDHKEMTYFMLACPHLRRN
jgi:hypothetical protein